MKTTLYSFLALFICVVFIGFSSFAQQGTDSLWKDDNFSGLKMRSIGPAFMSGRIADIAIHPTDENTWYVAVGSGGVWKTKNAGSTWNPVFDDQKSYSTGCITIDSSNPSRIWLGTGENVGGRHVGYGDGIYLSNDGGESWNNMGLKNTEHISKIIVHPTNPDIVWVAAQGPLWSKGGERGIYKTTDGGKTWTQTLGDTEWTGATDLLIDPRNPDRLYAATWQRHRTIAAYMGGGPNTAIYRSEDGGNTWTKLESGLPKSNMGKIGLAISPQQPDVVYAAIELDNREGGIYKSADRGANWKKQSDVVSGGTGPHYYQELYASPHQFDRIYLMDVRTQISEDGGKSFRQMKEEFKHSDNHAMAFSKTDADYLLLGTDGGLYVSHDLAENWRMINNMPITQFYKLAVDDAVPFYNVYGGTQDNSTEGGPSRTDNVQGIQNSDWKVVLFADGHQPATEPGNPDIVYAQWQEGNLARIDMKTGEVIKIQPLAAPGEPHERYNWDAPIFISPHSPTRLYHGSYRLWKSEDRGDSWTTISPDLTRNQNRIELPIMGKKQSIDNAWDLFAMSTYNTITSIAESGLKEGLIYIGTDDGLIQITENGGDTWRKIEVGSLPGVPATAYVNNIVADLHDANTAYIALDNHKTGDFKPYLLKTSDRGKTWQSIAGNLPARHLVWRLVQDHVNPQLLFIGTEYGIFFSHNSGGEWTKIKGGMPTIAVRDLTIQRREDDLVAATFGRSFYIFDNISVFRNLSDTDLKKEGSLYPTRDSWWFIPRSHLSFNEKKGNQGNSHYVADNPAHGALFTYHLHEGYLSKKEERAEREKELAKAKKDIPFAGWASLQDEEIEQHTNIWLLVKNSNNTLVNRVKGNRTKGFHRVAWDMRYPSTEMVSLDSSSWNAAADWINSDGILAPPGQYTVTLAKEKNGIVTALSAPDTFMLKPLYEGSLENPLADKREEFLQSYSSIVKNYQALTYKAGQLDKVSLALKRAYSLTPNASANLLTEIDSLRRNVNLLTENLDGNRARNQIGEKGPATLGDRVWDINISIGRSTYGPTARAMKNMEVVESDLERYSKTVRELDDTANALAREIDKQGGPFIQGVD